MVALSAALGSGVWCDGWSRPIYPNLWVVNIAPSGYGKSVALDMAESLIERAGIAGRKLPGSFSQEGLIRHLAENPEGVWFLQEFSAFQSMLDKGYNDGAQQWLTEAFDVPSEMPRVLTSERIVLRKPCISILGASSPSWFAAVYQESALRGGFLARFLFCPSAVAGEYVGHPGPRDDGVEARLAWHLKRCSELKGKFDISPILPTFRAWDEERRAAIRADCPPEFSGMRSRAGLLVLKATMLFHCSADPESLIATEKDLMNAIKYVEVAHAKAEKFLEEEVAGDPEAHERLKVREVLKRAGGSLDWSNTLKRSKLSSRRFNEAIDTMRSGGDVVIGYEGKSKVIKLAEGVPQSSLHFSGNSRETGIHLNGTALATDSEKSREL